MSPDAPGQVLPTGLVTFLMSDIEGSTPRWEAHAEEMARAVVRHYEILHAAVTAHGGARPVEQGEGDSMVAAFPRPADAVAAALDAQLALAAELWPDGADIRVRMAMHTAQAQVRDEVYYVGPPMIMCARLRALARGRQVLVSADTARALSGGLPAGATLRDLGRHHLKGMREAAGIFQLVHPDLPADFAPLRSPGLPAELTSFVGREAELADIAARFAHARLLTLVGPGGIGKTRLALRAAAALAPSYADGVHVCELAKLTDPDGVAAALGATLRIGELAGRGTLDRIVEVLAGKQVLLVVDNCEHVLDGAAEVVAAVLAEAHGVGLLATSRQRLGVDGEHAFRVGPLGVPDGDAATGPATTLFADRAAAARAGFRLGQDNNAAVAELCRRLDGHPLALELAAARTVSRTPAEILAEVTDRMTGLGDRRRTVVRHRSIDAVIGWSYDLLDPGERATFERLAVFPGSFTAEAASAVTGLSHHQTVDVVTDLVEHSLLSVHDRAGRSRFGMLEPVRQFAEARLRERDRYADARHRHAAFYVDWAEAGGAGLQGPDEGLWSAAVHAEIPNLRAAHLWCVREAPDADRAIRLSAALFPYRLHGRPFEVFVWAEATAEAFAGADHPLLSRCLAMAARGSWLRGDLSLARATNERAIAAVPAHAPELGRWAWLDLADTELLAGDLAAAAACGGRAAELAAAAGDRWTGSYGHGVRALALGYHAGAAAATADLAAMSALLGPDSSPTVLAYRDYIDGETAMESDLARALPLLRRARDTARGAGVEFLGSVAALSALCCAARLGDPADSLADYPALIDYWERAGAWTQQWITLRTLAEMFTRLGHDSPAALLHGALDAASASPVTGADADRMASDAATLRARLGDERYAGLRAAGAGLDGERAVAHARAAIAALAPAAQQG